MKGLFGTHPRGERKGVKGERFSACGPLSLGDFRRPGVKDVEGPRNLEGEQAWEG